MNPFSPFPRLVPDKEKPPPMRRWERFLVFPKVVVVPSPLSLVVFFFPAQALRETLEAVPGGPPLTVSSRGE